MKSLKWIPWNYAGGGVVGGGDGAMVAYLAGRMNDGTADDAGNLIAAAPEMYSTLKAITDCYGVGYKSAEQFVKDVHDFMMEGRAALAKARGETE
jgi:hypothetical protein